MGRCATPSGGLIRKIPFFQFYNAYATRRSGWGVKVRDDGSRVQGRDENGSNLILFNLTEDNLCSLGTIALVAVQ